MSDNEDTEIDQETLSADTDEGLDSALDTMDNEEREPVSVRDFLERAIDSDAQTDVPEEAPVEVADASGQDQQVSDETVQRDQQGAKAPVDWTPKERELWSKVPSEIQTRIKSREADIAKQIEGTAQARQTHDKISQLAQSFAPVMAAEGVSDPMVAVEGLFQKVSELRMGSPENKAALVASIVKDYGVDIGLLDSALVGGAPQGQQSQPQIDPTISHLIDQKMQPVNQMMNQLNSLYQQDQTRHQEDAAKSVQDFAQEAEFLNDVRHDMADLIDLAAKNGRNLTLKDAYDRACALHPEISQVLEQRKKEQSILAQTQSNNAKKLASSSVMGRQSGTGNIAQSGNSIRSMIESAWDDTLS